jgi:hypothetical protein
MSSTPLFDTIARRTDRVGVIGRDVAPSTPAVARATFTPASVPADLVAAIDAIPAQMAAVTPDQPLTDAELALVERVGDEFIRIIVDTLSAELDRISRDRVVRG